MKFKVGDMVVLVDVTSKQSAYFLGLQSGDKVTVVSLYDGGMWVRSKKAGTDFAISNRYITFPSKLHKVLE